MERKEITRVSLPSHGGALVRVKDMTFEEAVEAIQVLGGELRKVHENAAYLRPLQTKPHKVHKLASSCH
jgi:hypothetical protein